MKKKAPEPTNISDDDLLTAEQAAEQVCFGKIKAVAIRKRMREGALPCHYKPGILGRIFVKRGEVAKLYEESIYGWIGKEGRR